MLIGITGKIGTGKHTAAFLLEKYLPNSIILDTDKVAHQLYSSEGDCFEKIIKAFGSSILAADKKHIDRKKLGKKAFSDPNSLQKLNRIVHPLLRNELLSKINVYKKEGKNIILVAAILEKLKIPCDRIVEIKASKNACILRIQRRDGLRKDEVLSRLSFQKDCKKADYLIENDKDLDCFEEEMRKLAEILKGL